jgi:uncharacterized alpha-E superfamily protein
MLLSSVAERVYWLARYIERVENTARIIMVNNNLLMDLPRNMAYGWEPIIAIMGSMDQFYELYDEATERNVIKFLVFDSRNSNCILNVLAHARENLRTTRAICPRAVWEVVNDLYSYAKENKASVIGRKGRYDYMKHLINSCLLLMGKFSSTMSHDQTYNFFRIGKNIERGDMTSRVIDVRANNLLPKESEELKPFDDIQWKGVLELVAAYQMYRRYVHVRVRGAEVLRYLLQDPYFPRTVTRCLTEVEHCLHELPRNEAPLRALGSAQRMVQDITVEKVIGENLNEYINDLQLRINDVHDQLAVTYFDGIDELAERKMA